MNHNTPKGTDVENDEVGNNNTDAASNPHLNKYLIQRSNQVQEQYNT
jgi:hypothetical protein